MHAKNTAINNRGECEVIEDLAAVAPDVRGAVLALALVEEAVHLRDLPRLVVPPDERDPVGVAHFVREQQEEGLDGVEPAVDEVACVCEMGGCEQGRTGRKKREEGRTHEEVVRVRTEPADLEELHHVPELTMYIPAYLQGIC